MKKQILLITLLMALLAPVAMNGQSGTLHKSRARSARPELENNTTLTFSNDKGNRDASYEKVTSAQSDWSGNYLLAASTTSTNVEVFNGTVYDNVYTLNSSTSTNTSVGSFEYLTQSDNVISSITGSDGDGAILTIAPVTASGYTSYYTIRINGGDYLGSTTTGGMITNSSANSTAYYWNISYNTSTSSVYLYTASTNSSTYRICYFVEDDNGTTYGGFCSNQIYYSGSTFDYNDVTLYKEVSSGSDNYVWVETTTITPNEEYLIGFSNGSDVYLAVNYAVSQTNHYYESSNSSYYGYTAKASFDGNGYVTGVSGHATDLQYCTWKFSSASGGTITSGYESNKYLRTWTSTSYADCYVDGTSQTWTYSSGKLYRTISSTNRYAQYTTINSTPHMCVGNSVPTGYSVKLYTKQLVETGYAVNTSTTVTNGSIQYSINGGYDWYDNLSNVPAGETVVISLEPETGFQLTGAPTVTPTSGTAPTVTGSGNLYSFVMPESDVTVNATFSCTAPADPTFSVAAGTYTTVQNVSISCATAGATIYYTTDGSTPTNSSTQYTGAITINSTTTLKAIAYIGTCTSGVTTATYTMDLPTYTVTCATGLPGGSIAVNPTSAVEGTTITITATPESGYFLGTITATDASNNNVAVTVNGNEGSFTMPASNVTVTATFTQGFHVTLNQTPNGTISADQTTNLQPGDIVTLTATPDNGCVFLAWYVYKTGSPRAVISVVTNSWFFMPSSDVTVQAVFVTEEEHEQIVGGGSNTDGNLPTNVYNKYSLSQQIYTAAEIGYNGRITAIAFKANGTATRDLEVYMAHTDLTAFGSNTGWEVMGSVAQVFAGSVSFTSSDWTTITLDTPFEYDGTSNLNICVADRTGSWVTNITFNTYSTSANRALYITNDNTDFGAGVGYSNQLEGYSGTLSTSNNQIKFTIKTPGSAESLTISPDAINDFSYVEGQGPSQTHKLDIVGVDLENDITVTAPTNFEICLTEDGTYSSSLSIPRETSKRGRGVTTWNFDDGLQGWTVNDADGDGYNWTHMTSSSTLTGHNGSTGFIYSASYDNSAGTLTPDNWLISPQVELGGSFSMWTTPRQAAYPNEHFGIYVSITNTDPSSFIMLSEWTMNNKTWKQYSVDLSAFAGQTGYIAIRHFNCSDVFVMHVDDFMLDTDAAITVEMPVTMTLETVFVRMKVNLDRGNYSGDLTATAGTGDNVNGSVSLSGVVEAPSYNITLTANPVEGGSVAGAGSYTDGSSVTVSATAQRPYSFINWTENGTVVSTDASYTFTVNGSDRTLVANFGITKEIKGYGTSNGGYYLIASPIASNIAPTNVQNMTSGSYDLYRFNQSIEKEWENYKNESHTTGFVLEPGKGYLYANSVDVTLVFTGTPVSGNSYNVALTEDTGNDKRGAWNLVGNSFTVPANIGATAYYKMKSDGSDVESVTGGTIGAMEGIFMLYDADNGITSVTFTKGDAQNNGKMLTLNVTQGRSNIDRAIVRFDEGNQLPKFQIFENTKVYFPQGTNDFAVVNAEAQGEMPVNFEATSNGTYTLSFNAENVEFSYLHLIDNMTGAEVDLLETPSYSFNATTSDYASRFKLVFAQGNNSNSNEFAFISDGNIIVNGEGLLQVIDMTGRVISTSQVSGMSNIKLNAAAGVYVLKLNDKTQKIVVK